MTDSVKMNIIDIKYPLCLTHRWCNLFYFRKYNFYIPNYKNINNECNSRFLGADGLELELHFLRILLHISRYLWYSSLLISVTPLLLLDHIPIWPRHRHILRAEIIVAHQDSVQLGLIITTIGDCSCRHSIGKKQSHHLII